MQVQKVILYSINPGTVPILEQIINLLAKQKIDYFLEQSTAERFEQLKAPVVNMDHETIDHDLVIVVGGDGSILKAHSKNVLTAPVLPNKIIIAKPITKGGVIMGNTDRILIVFLNLKLVLAIRSAKPKPKTVEEKAVKVPIVTVFQKTPHA